MRNVFTGKSETIDGSVTYKEWRDGMSDEEKAAFELAQKKDSRRTADKARYAQYKSVLGTENVPKTLDEFRNVMYNGGEEAERLKYYYRNINGRPIEYVKIDYDLAQSGVTGKGKAYSVEDIEIKGWKSHAENRMTASGLTKEQALKIKSDAIAMMKKWLK